MNKSEITASEFVEPREEPAELLHEAEHDFDFVSLCVEHPVSHALVGTCGSRWDDSHGAPSVDRLQDLIGIVGFVSDHRGGRNAVKQAYGLRRITGLTSGQDEPERIAEAVGKPVDLAREAAS